MSTIHKSCSVEGCNVNAHYIAKGAKGFCGAHYQRFRRHGDPLGGGTARGVLMQFIEEVALCYQGDDCLLWPFGRNSDGYGHLIVEGKDIRAHRLVCERVHGPPPTPEHEAAHSCGKGHEGCIAFGHLGWKTHAQNQRDRLIHGTHARGERNPQAKLTENDVRQIMALKGVQSQQKIAAQFGVTGTTIRNIHLGRTWACLSRRDLWQAVRVGR